VEWLTMKALSWRPSTTKKKKRILFHMPTWEDSQWMPQCSIECWDWLTMSTMSTRKGVSMCVRFPAFLVVYSEEAQVARASKASTLTFGTKQI
jgi:hypothetical protein